VRHFKRVLVYVHVDSLHQQAMERAVRLAVRNEAALTLVADVEAAPWLTERLMPSAPDRTAEIVSETDEKLKAMAEPVADCGLSVTTKTLVGRPWLELVREVLRNQHELVIKDIEPAADAEGIFSPHMDMRLLRKCPCPVWLVRPQASSFRRVAAAVDVFPIDETTHAFNEKIVHLAASIAECEGSELHIVCAWSVYAESVLRFKMDPSEVEQVREATKREIEHAVRELLPSCGGVIQPSLRLLEGDPETAIPQLVENEHEDLVVMGTVARSGMAGALIGNTAERILGKLKCSLLALKPDGFVSPVKLKKR
jgi:nucleotide-binding universal stress UspA family protein